MKSRPSVVFWTNDERQLSAVKDALAMHSSGARMIVVSSPAHVLERLRHGEVSLDFCPRTGPALVFINLDAIGPGALDFVREMRADPLLRRIPILACAGEPGDATVLAAYEYGVNAFIECNPSSVDFPAVVTCALDFWLETAKLPPEPFFPASKVAEVRAHEYADFTYRMYSQHQLGVAVKSGVLHGKPLLNYIETFFNDPEWNPGFSILDDYRSVTRIDITSAEAREIATMLDVHRPSLEGGRTAIVVDAWMHQVVSEILISMGRLDRERVRVVRSLTEALAWLQIPVEIVPSILPK